MTKTIAKQLKDISITVIRNLLDKNCNYELYDKDGIPISCELSNYNSRGGLVELTFLLSKRKDVDYRDKKIIVKINKYSNIDFTNDVSKAFIEICTSLPEYILNNTNWTRDELLSALDLNHVINAIDYYLGVVEYRMNTRIYYEYTSYRHFRKNLQKCIKKLNKEQKKYIGSCILKNDIKFYKTYIVE